MRQMKQARKMNIARSRAFGMHARHPYRGWPRGPWVTLREVKVVLFIEYS